MAYKSYRPEDFEAIVTKHENRLYRTALAITGNMSDAEDIVQEAFLRAYERAPDFETEEHEKAWLIRVTVNLCNSRLRSPWRKRIVPILDSYPTSEPEQHELLEQIMTLPTKYRTVIHLFYYERYSIKDISELTGQKESTVRSHLTRARQKLKINPKGGVKMKDYKDYMDNLSVDETLHEKIMYRLTQSPTRQHIGTNNLRKYISVAACTTVMLFFIIGVYPHMNIWNTTPNGSNSNIPNAAGDPNPRQDKLNTIEQSRAVYHDVDASQLIRQISSAKVPFGFFFNNKLIALVRINSGIKNNGVRWEEHKYTKNDVESALQASVKSPNLPDGDYTTKQYVLVDEATENIIAYQTVYYFFNKNTLEFQNRFSVFYFAEQYFESDALEHMKNVSTTNGEISISDFPEPGNVHVKVPHVRKLVYVENGISVVIEAEADFVQEDGVVDKEKSLERYKQTDKQLVDIMKSLVE